MYPCIPPLHRFSIAFLALAAAAAAEPKRVTNEELSESIEWFDRLTVPDVAGKPFIEVVEQRFLSDGGVYENRRRGFLIAEDETAWTLVLDETNSDGFIGRRGKQILWPVRIAKPKTTALPGASAEKRALDLREVAAEIRARIEKKKARDDTAFGSLLGRGGDGMVIFVLARLCERSGNAEAARSLDGMLLGLKFDPPRELEAGAPRRERPFTLRAHLERELGWELLRDTMMAFGEENLPRDELLVRFEWLAKEFSGIDDIEAVREHLASSE